MPVKIKEMSSKYPLRQEDLKSGIMYEGSDKELYIGVNLKGIIGQGVGTTNWIDNDTAGVIITFREVDTVIEYK